MESLHMSLGNHTSEECKIRIEMKSKHFRSEQGEWKIQAENKKKNFPLFL